MAYTVKSGDSLSKIAKANGMTLDQLLLLNPGIENPNLIRPGDTIVLEDGKDEKKKQTTDAGGGVETEEGAAKGENKAKKGVGGGGEDPDTQLTILTGKEMKWYFDKASGKWYVEYGLPGSDRTMLFEATPEQMDALFGDDHRPVDFQRRTLKQLTQRRGTTFAGNVSEMEGTGTFEAEVERVTVLALDEGKLPDWAKDTPEVMDIIYTAQAEGKSTDWILEQMSRTDGFKERFPKIKKFMSENNLSLSEGISGFLQYEAQVKSVVQQSGRSLKNVSPELIGNLLDAGHSITTIKDTVTTFERMKKFKPALAAFNSVLEANGMDTIKSLQEMFDFVQGNASSEVYDMYEASSIQEAAVGAGLGDLFSAQDAIDAAYQGNFTLETATAGMSKAAELLLRMRHEVDTGKFGLDHEELLDISLGQVPRSGRSQAEIFDNINRAVLSAQKGLQKRATTFKGFSDTGQQQDVSLRGLRQQS